MIWNYLLKARKQVLARFFPGGSKRPFLAFGLVIILLTACLFGALVEDVIRRDSLALYDLYFGKWLLNHTSTAGNSIFYTITLLGSFPVVETVVAAMVLWLTWRKRWLHLCILLISVGGGTLLNGILKSIFLRPRPDFMDALYLETSYSFPSGHAMTAVFAYGAIAYLITSSTKNRKWRTSLYAWAALLSLLIGFSRLYLGVHYLTDVLGGWAAGMTWLFTYILVVESLKLPE